MEERRNKEAGEGFLYPPEAIELYFLEAVKFIFKLWG